jgi:peptidoglycan/LPS O-acetylase OafA/YrhL
MAQYWSLAVEEQFYLIWPVIVAICTRKRLLQIAIGGSVVAVLLRLGFLAAGTDPEALYRNTFTRMDSLLIGAVCSILIRNEAGIEWVRRHRVWLGWLPVAVLGGLHLAVDPFKNIAPAIVGMGFSLIALSYAGLLLSVVASAGSGSVLDRAFANPILRAFGKYSYAAYLLQFLGRNLVLNNEARLRVRSPGPVNILLEIGVTFALSFASYYLLERHFLVWKRRFDPRLPALSTKAALAAN